MKAQRSIRPSFEALERKALLSASLLSHSPAHVAAPPALVADSMATGVQLSGGLLDGYGGVSPLGGVRGHLNLSAKTLTLSNRRGSLELHLSEIYQHPYTFTARAWQIMKGTGQFASLQGSGACVVSAVTVNGRTIVWSATLY